MAEAKRRTSELKSVTDDKAIAATAIGKAAAAVEHRLYNLYKEYTTRIEQEGIGFIFQLTEQYKYNLNILMSQVIAPTAIGGLVWLKLRVRALLPPPVSVNLPMAWL